MTIRRRTFVYDRSWVLIRAFLAICTFLAALVETYLAREFAWSVFEAQSDQTRIWMVLLLPIPFWFVTQFVVAGAFEFALRAVGLLGWLAVDAEGVEVRLRKSRTRIAWRDVRAVGTGKQPVTIGSAALAVGAPALAGQAIAEIGAALAKGQWLLHLATEQTTLTVEGGRFLRPLDTERRFKRILADALGVTFDSLEQAAQIQLPPR